MKKIILSFTSLFAMVPAIAQNNDPMLTAQPNIAESPASAPIAEMILPILFISFLIFMFTSLVKYFLEFRLKNKLIDRGMADQLSVLSGKSSEEKKHEAIKLAILFCGIGLGLTVTYLTAPVNIHSLAIMAFSVGLSYWAYFFYLRRKNR